jgi:hypothetical protein
MRLGGTACALATMLLASAGGALAAAPSIPLAQAHLTPYGATYAISGDVRGMQVWQVSRGGGATTVVTIQTRLAGQSETDRFVLAAKGLGLRSASERLRAKGLTLVISAVASGAQLSETAVVNGRTEHVTYPLTAASYVNEALLTVLTGLSLKTGQRSVVHDILLQHAADVPVGLAVGGASRVRTGAGTFRCLRLAISSAGGTQTAWLSTGAQPVLVRYANGQTTFTLTSLRR